ncbi:MAG: hypothetical protein IKL44_01760 [Clostridia bacterium]|nr:hypothetical protein [Clostridia bacterium]
MKKTLALILLAATLLSLTACTAKPVSDAAVTDSEISTPSDFLPTISDVTSSDVSFDDVSSMEEFADRLEDGGYDVSLKEEKGGAITVKLETPKEPTPTKPDTTVKPAIPTVKPTPKPTPTPTPTPTEPEKEPEAPVEPEKPEEPEEPEEPETPTEPTEPEEETPAPAPEVKPSNKTHTYTTGQQHTALKVTDNYLYSALNAEQKQWYLAIDEAINSLEPSVVLDKEVGEGRNYYIYFTYMFDNPQHFYLGNTFTLFRRGDVVEIMFCYSDGVNFCNYGSKIPTLNDELKASILAKKAVFDKKVNDIVSTIPGDAPEVEKERLIYDYILKNSHYNLGAKWNGVCEDNWNSYGILVNGYGVCESYSEAFQTLCHRVGINCTGIVGDAGGGHKWNAVKIDGDWYTCDITFDDPIGSAPDDAYHFYFNMTTKQMEERHHSTEGSDYPGPICTATKYNYLTYYGEY